MTSARVWSFHDMLKELEHEKLAQSLTMLASGGMRFKMLDYLVVQHRGESATVGLDELPQGIRAAENLRRIAEKLQMPGVVRGFEMLRDVLLEHASITDLTPQSLQRLSSAVESAVSAFGNELEARKLFVMTPQFASYYSQNEPLFGSELADAFPESSDDIDEAGKCLALGLPTACVFHLMRAAESTARTLVRSFGGATHKEDGEPHTFGGLFNQVGGKVDAVSKRADKDSWNKVKGFMSSLNRGDRTKVAHPGRFYSEQQAEGLFALVRSFMEEAKELL